MADIVHAIITVLDFGHNLTALAMLLGDTSFQWRNDVYWH